MPISTLQFSNLGPFDRVVEFEFDTRVNVFVGPNNCGKSPALFALADVGVPGFGLPPKLLRAKHSEFLVRVSASPRGERSSLKGRLPITVKSAEPGYKRWYSFHQGLGYTTFVPALRWNTDFRSEGPIRKKRRESGGDRFVVGHEETHRHFLERIAQENYPSLVRDATVVQEMVELDYRAYRQKKPAMRRIIDRIASIASEITEGFAIKFAGIAEDERGLYPQFEIPDGTVPLDVLSQGTQSLIQWLARLLIGYAKHYDFPSKLGDNPGVLIIDEIDAHLHPSWQRRIIPAITKQFPSLQIFCSTHSPLMLAGLKAGQIHLFTRDKKGRVIVSRNETDIIGWSADEIVTTFLGVENATDLQTEKSLGRLRELRGKKRLTPKDRKELESLRDTVNQRLLGGPAVEEIDQLAERLNRSLAKTAPRKSNKKGRTVRKPVAIRTKRIASTSGKAKK